MIVKVLAAGLRVGDKIGAFTVEDVQGRGDGRVQVDYQDGAGRWDWWLLEKSETVEVERSR